MLRGVGWEVVNPAEINLDPDAEWTGCMRADIAQLVHCTHIALLPGWERSPGARLEEHIAHALKMPHLFLDAIL